MRQTWESPKLRKTLGPRKQQVSWRYSGRSQRKGDWQVAFLLTQPGHDFNPVTSVAL